VPVWVVSSYDGDLVLVPTGRLDEASEVLQAAGHQVRRCPDRTPRTGRSMTAVVLRPATPADSEFCYQLHKAAMRDYITATWGWDEQRQRASHDRAFSPGRWQIITAD
jgi:hypothetical protein